MVASVNLQSADMVYAELRSAILSGQLPSGAPAVEMALADQYGVSRTPVREALRRLYQDQLLARGPRGLIVRVVPAEEILQIYDLRILLESEAAGQAAEARTESDLIALEGLLARHRAMVDPDDERRGKANMELHAAVWSAAHNAVLEDLLKRLTTQSMHQPRSSRRSARAGPRPWLSTRR